MKTDSETYYSYKHEGILFTTAATTATIRIERGTVTKTDFPVALTSNFGYSDITIEPTPGSSYSQFSTGYGNLLGRNGYAIGTSNQSLGYNSIAAGIRNEIANTGSAAIAAGDSNKISGKQATAIGAQNTASGA